jgi:hypothetical protein
MLRIIIGHQQNPTEIVSILHKHRITRVCIINSAQILNGHRKGPIEMAQIVSILRNHRKTWVCINNSAKIFTNSARNNAANDRGRDAAIVTITAAKIASAIVQQIITKCQNYARR